MKATAKAIRKAKEKYDEKKDYDFCLAQGVCPKCASDLKDTVIPREGIHGAPMPPPTINVKCTNTPCDFKYTV